jgi:transposase
LPPLDDISKEELYNENIGLRETNIELKEKLAGLQFQVAQFNRLVFGQTRERFVPTQSPKQATLFTSHLAPQNNTDNTVQAVVLAAPKKKGQEAGKPNPNHNGRNQFPAHLPRMVEILTPEIVAANPTDFSKIGQEITETLDYTPAKLFVVQRVREKYVFKGLSKEADTESLLEGVIIAPMPERPLPKCIAEAGLLAQILVDKFVDHLPIDRQTKRFKRESGIDIKGSTIVGWSVATADLLMPLYDKLTELVFDCSYLQADESTLKSLEDAPKGKSHTAYQWVYRNVEKGLILFDYQRGRSGECLHPRVKSHIGYLQSDGYSVYDALEGLDNLVLVNCMAHARREFFEAKQNDPHRAEIALDFIQQLYKIEESICSEGLQEDKIVERRQEKSIPILLAFKTWLEAENLQTLPKSPIGKAIAYTLKRWNKLTVFTTIGALEIDNNRIENAIRPLALGRKNYLFVGSDEGGKRAAMMYSFFASCKIHNLNPLKWLTDVLRRIPNHPINQIDELLPHNWGQGY